jgi:benzaldehyde dehydrogenase (NAD)
MNPQPLESLKDEQPRPTRGQDRVQTTATRRTNVTSILTDRIRSGHVYLGEWREPRSTFTSTEPATGRAIGLVGLTTPEDVDASVLTARSVQAAWAAIGFDVRATVLRRAAQLFLDHAQEIGELFSREVGAPATVAGRQGHFAAEECFEAAALASIPPGEVLRTAQQRFSITRHVPVGVVGVIAPFNSPMILSMRAVAPALALGNAVVLKPDPRTAIVGGTLLARIFEEAGLPAGLLHVLSGHADVGEAIVEHPHVPVIAFTGSTSAGRAIAVAAARHLKRVHLELGGNSAALVLEDADVARAARAGAMGSFGNSGQICMATGRHLVHESIAEEYVERMIAIAAGLTVGDPLEGADLGPLIDSAQCARVDEMVRSSVNAGATLRCGGVADAPFYPPTILTDVPQEAPAYHDEVFGPVASVVTFRDETEAVSLARDSEYGLSLSVFTADVARALALVEQIPTGMAHINDMTVNREVVAPFGGVGWSGNGSRHGSARANLDAFTELQWVTFRG